MDHFRDHLAFGLHAMHGRHIQKTSHYSVDGGVPQAVANCGFKPAPLSRLAAQAAAPFSASVGNVSESPKSISNLVPFVRVHELCEISAKELFRTQAESTRGSRICMEHNAVRAENGKQFVGAIEQRGKLLGSGRYTWFER